MNAKRSVAFSVRQKKKQLQAKRLTKKSILTCDEEEYHNKQDVLAINSQPSAESDSTKYALKFYSETEAELKQRKEESFKPLNPVSEKELEIDSKDFFLPELSFPKRPPWVKEMTPAQLEAQEQKYFNEYLQSLHDSPYWKDLSYFELNLETWRQLWRVLEMCDILLLVVDVRYAGCMFPPSLFEHVTQQQKQMVLVLNKVDLVPASVAAAWADHFTARHPGLKVVYFTSCPGYNLRGGTSDKSGLLVRRRKGRPKMCTEGATKLLKVCQDLVQGAVDLSSWEKKIREESKLDAQEDDEEDLAPTEIGHTVVVKADASYFAHERFARGELTLGVCGQPNVGKSSLLNALMGRKVVSVSRTPGHTKYFQTIYLTPQVRLCDCPGLVFPSIVPRPIQILMESFPVAQLREPYTTIRFLAERIDLPKLLRMDHPDNAAVWSPRDICDGWAKKRGYYTARTSWLDSYRAANSLLRMALEGKICLWLRPPGFTEDREKWEASEEVKYVEWVQALSGREDQEEDSAISDSDSHDDDDDDEDESDDEQATAAVANKFAALMNDE